MMRLSLLRHQLLIAMGVPACWTQHVPEPTPAPKPPAVEAFDARACPPDSIPESVCGMRDEDLGRCGPRGDSLASFDEVKLWMTEDTGEKQAFKRFALDEAGTAAYRRTLAADGVVVTEHCCYSRCTPLEVGHAPPAEDRLVVTTTRCFPKPPRGTRLPAREAPGCPTGVRINRAMRPYVEPDDGEDGTCCYEIPRRFEHRPVKGRPARVEGEARYARVGAPRGASGAAAGAGAGAGWRAPEVRPVVEALPTALRDRLAAAWVAAAQEEHASIASFANLSLRLLALGAPPDLVADAHAAALDEIRHARLAFELASAYAGAPLAPVRFADAARMSAAGDLAALALETLADGCINEAVAAVEAAEAGAAAADPVIAEALRGIAEDEARHAALAWRIVAWCVQGGGGGEALLAALREAAAVAQAAALAPPAAAAGDRARLAAHGVLGDDALAAVRAGVLREIVAPCLAALAPAA